MMMYFCVSTSTFGLSGDQRNITLKDIPGYEYSTYTTKTEIVCIGLI